MENGIAVDILDTVWQLIWETEEAFYLEQDYQNARATIISYHKEPKYVPDLERARVKDLVRQMVLIYGKKQEKGVKAKDLSRRKYQKQALVDDT